MRIRTILSAAAVPVALAAALLGTTGAASAAVKAPNPNSYITLNTQHDYYAEFAKSVDVPFGQTVQLDGGVIHGNVTVEGTLSMSGVTVEGNVTVSDNGIARTPGTGAELSLYNQPSHITGNLSVTGSVGGNNGNGTNNGTAFFTNADEPGGPTPVTQVDGNFAFTNNAGWIQDGSAGAVMHVNGNALISGNTISNPADGFQYGEIQADGHLTVA